MKHFKSIFRIVWLSVLLLISSHLSIVKAAPSDTPADDVGSASADSAWRVSMDSVEVSLLTCQPHEEIYSLYGHTAIRYHDPRNGEDWSFNYGVFNFHAPFFVFRFVFGLTDYELGVVPTKIFKMEYRHYGSMVTEQVLNMTAKEKVAIYKALAENYQEENRIYRYNYFYDNCTLRARDIIERCIQGKVLYQERPDYTPTYRQMVHHCTGGHPWATWGCDFLLGLKADSKTTLRQQEFLPNNLMADFSHAQIVRNNGQYTPLVKETRTMLPSGIQLAKDSFPLTPRVCAILLAIVSLLIFGYERKKKKTLKWWDIVFMTLQGIMGCILFVMIFSQHPTTSINLQILLFNPIPLLYIYKVYKRKKTVYWKLLLVMTLLFLIGNFAQEYAEGMNILALCLLTRYTSNIRYGKK